MRRAVGPAEASTAASPLPQEPGAGADHHPQLWGRLGLESETRGTSRSPFQDFVSKTEPQPSTRLKKKHCHRLTLILNSSVEKVIGGKDEFTTAAKRVLLSL